MLGDHTGLLGEAEYQTQLSQYNGISFPNSNTCSLPLQMALQELPLLSNKEPKSLLPPLDQQEGCSLQRCLAENSSVLETLWDLTLKPQTTATSKLTGHVLKRPANPVKGAERKNKTKKLH